LAAAYASHGDTRHVLLFPSDPKDCFDMMIDGFDLAERLQTPVIIMSDLDLGMNDHVSEPLLWDDSRKYDRGKVLSAADLDKMQDWGRYLDIDGDGVCYRTYPGTHPSKGAYFTRGSSHNEYATYTEEGATYERIMNRLLTKWETAKTLVPQPEIREAGSKIGVIYYGTSTHAVMEALELLKTKKISMNTLRLKAFPFQQEVKDFINRCQSVFVIEQNRDGQMRRLLQTECDILPEKLIPITHFDGLPITADFITTQITEALAAQRG
jgi:2-oxoglutarate ferredoxin oxidoreductase subunit alpha